MIDKTVHETVDTARKYMEKGQYLQAIAACEKVIEADHQCNEAWALLGALHQQEGDLQRAEACYRSALKSMPDDLNAMTDWCSILPKVDYPAEADALIATIAGNAGNDPEINAQLAGACSALGRHMEAMQFIGNAIKSSPRNGRYRLIQADLLEKRGDFEECFFILRPYLEAKEPNPGAVLVFARICHIMDLRNECLLLLDRVLDNKQLSIEAKKRFLETKEWVSKSDMTGNT